LNCEEGSHRRATERRALVRLGAWMCRRVKVPLWWS